MPRVYVAIGSNVAPAAHVRAGLDALQTAYAPLSISPAYRSAAVGFVGDDFLNAVVGFDTEVAVRTLVEHLHAIEDAQGRQRDGPRYGSRTLDLDLLLYGDQIIQEQGLVLPHRDILRYPFVLRPLAEIAGAECHPVLGQRYDALWAAFEPKQPPLIPVAWT